MWKIFCRKKLKSVYFPLDKQVLPTSFQHSATSRVLITENSQKIHFSVFDKEFQKNSFLTSFFSFCNSAPHFCNFQFVIFTTFCNCSDFQPLLALFLEPRADLLLFLEFWTFFLLEATLDLPIFVGLASFFAPLSDGLDFSRGR